MEPKSPAGMKYAGVGITWVASVLLFLWLGSLIDGRLETKPVFTVTGALIGIVTGFVSLIRQVKQDSKPYRKTDGDGTSDR